MSPTHEDAELCGNPNALNSACQLPTELLAEIFQRYGESVQAFFHVEYFAGLKTATHICHSWREVAIGTPRLWCTPWITAESPKTKITELFLARSRPLPFRVRVCHRDNLTSLRAILNEVSRFGAILAPTASRESWGAFLSMLPESLPAVQSVTMFTEFTLDGLPLPFLFHGCDFPGLRHLEYKNCYSLPPLDRLWSPSLTSLSLVNVDISERTAEITRKLAEMPALRQLMLSLCDMEELDLPEDITSFPPHSELIVLPNLEKLRLVGSTSECVFWVLHIVSPATTSIFITVNQSGSGRLPLVAESIERRLSGKNTIGTPPRFRSCSIFHREIRQDQQFVLHLSDGYTGAPAAAPVFDIALARGRISDAGIIEDVFSRLSLQAVKNLSIGSFVGVAVPPLQGLVANVISDVVHLNILGPSPTRHEDYWANLYDTVLLGGRGNTVEPPIILPQLQTLTIDGLELPQKNTRFVDATCSVLQRRISAGVPLRELVLIRAENLDDQFIRALEVVVPVRLESHSLVWSQRDDESRDDKPRVKFPDDWIGY